MRTTEHINEFRITKGPTSSNDSMGNYGSFAIPIGNGSVTLVCVSADGDKTGWEHVSVQTRYRRARDGRWMPRTPSWEEMTIAKTLFFEDHEWTVQFHPAKLEGAKVNPHVLDLWRPETLEFPVPPREVA